MPDHKFDRSPDGNTANRSLNVTGFKTGISFLTDFSFSFPLCQYAIDHMSICYIKISIFVHTVCPIKDVERLTLKKCYLLVWQLSTYCICLLYCFHAIHGLLWIKRKLLPVFYLTSPYVSQAIKIIPSLNLSPVFVSLLCYIYNYQKSPAEDNCKWSNHQLDSMLQ